MGATGLSSDPTEYRARLAEQPDDQIDAWVAELLRDVVIRRGIVKVVDDFRRADRPGRGGFERVFASGVGHPRPSDVTGRATSSCRPSRCTPSCPGCVPRSPTLATA